MILPSLILLASLSSGAPATADSATPIDRIVVVLGQNDPVSSSRVLRHLKGCTDGIPTAVVSSFGEFRIDQDFTTGFSLAAQLPPEWAGRARGPAASLQLLAEALAPVGPTTAIIVISPRIGADSGIDVPSPDQPYVDGAESPPVFWDTVAIPKTVIEARKSLRKAGLTVVAVNTSGTYDAGVKALTEIPKGRYLQYSQRNFSKDFVSALCAPGR